MTKYKLQDESRNQSEVTLTSYLIAESQMNLNNLGQMPISEYGDSVPEEIGLSNGGFEANETIDNRLQCTCANKCKFFLCLISSHAIFLFAYFFTLVNSSYIFKPLRNQNT